MHKKINKSEEVGSSEMMDRRGLSNKRREACRGLAASEKFRFGGGERTSE